MAVTEEGAPPHGALLAVVVGVVVAGPFLLGEKGQAVADAVAELLSPAGLFLLPLALILAIRFLSSDRGSALLSVGSRDSIHHVGGSPVGVALLLVLIVLLLYCRFSLFGHDDAGE